MLEDLGLSFNLSLYLNTGRNYSGNQLCRCYQDVIQETFVSQEICFMVFYIFFLFRLMNVSYPIFVFLSCNMQVMLGLCCGIFRLFAFLWHVFAMSVASLSTLLYIVLQSLYRLLSYASSSWMYTASTKVFNTAGLNIRIRCSQILYWPLFLQDRGIR